MGAMSDAIIDCLRYFGQFSYAPSIDEIYTFLKTKTSKKDLQRVIQSLVKKGYLKAFKLSESGEDRYYIEESVS